MLGKVGAAACFVEPENRGMSLWGILDDVAARAARPAAARRRSARPRMHRGRHSRSGWTEAARRRRARWSAAARAVRPEHTSQIQFTSGTTGFPKGAELRHGGLTDNAMLFAERARFHLGGRHCNPMPFFHCGGCVMATIGCISKGSAQLPTLTFDPARMVGTIDAEKRAPRPAPCRRC